MIPKNKTPEEAQDAYREIVAAVKAKYAEKDPHTVSGEQVSHEIAKRWAKACGQSFEEKKPEPPDGTAARAEVRDLRQRGVVTKTVEGREGPFDVPVPK